MKEILGNASAKDYLERILSKERIPHALLFSGPFGIGKGLIAKAFAKRVIGSQFPNQIDKIENDNHPDVHFYHPTGKMAMHSIDSVRSLCEEVALTPYEASRKFFIIHDADRMLPTSANALLKTLEEAGNHSVIILLTSHFEGLLPTIVSRCQMLPFYPIKESLITDFLKQRFSNNKENCKKVAYLAQGSISRALDLIEQENDKTYEYLLNLLCKGKNLGYQELLSLCQKIHESLENDFKLQEKNQEKTLTKNYPDLTALNKSYMLKGAEGDVALKFRRRAFFLFETILAWYRDLYLLKKGVDDKYLVHSDHRKTLLVLSNQQETPSLSEVHLALLEAKAAFERSIKFNQCLESLFLKLL